MWFLKVECAPRRQWVTAPPRHQGRRQRIYCDFSASCRLTRWFLTLKCCWQLHCSSISLFAPSFLIHHAAANALRVLHIKSFLLSLGQSRVLKLHCIEPAGPFRELCINKIPEDLNEPKLCWEGVWVRLRTMRQTNNYVKFLILLLFLFFLMWPHFDYLG